MFSSTYHDSNLFPNFPSSSYPPFFIDPQNDFANNTLLIDDPLLVPPPILFPQETVANLSLADCTAILEQDGCYGGTDSISSIPNFLTQKPAIAKKDRHSKIHTSQGLRDRRVRLSSEIARKFFDLQDMLEFDKPSNTLEWLFTKSENAIKELARSKHNSREGEKCSCDPSSSNNKSLSGSNKGGRKLKCTQREDVCVQTKKESRERARARARERTCYKMCNNGRVQEFEEIIRCPVTANARPTIQSTQPEPCARWHQLVQLQPYPHPLLDTTAEPPSIDGFNIIEESIVIKRNMMSSSSSSSTSSHHHQNLVIPKEPSFNNNNDYPLFPYSTTTPNWDTNGHSNFCGIATMNMNLSTCFMNQCFQMFGNSWEERTN